MEMDHSSIIAMPDGKVFYAVYILKFNSASVKCEQKFSSLVSPATFQVLNSRL